MTEHSTAIRERDMASRSRRPVHRLAGGHVMSVSANVVITVAIPWLVLTTTGSAGQAGLALFAGALGAAVGGLAAGLVVHRLGAVRTSACADLVSALAVLPLPVLLVLDVLQLHHVLLLAVVGALGDSAGWTARQALVPQAADDSGMPRERANARFTSGEHVAYLLGAPAAGLLITLVGVGGTLLAAVCLFVLAALVVRRLPEPDVDAVDGAEVASAHRAGGREVFAVIWSDPLLRALMIFPTASVVVVGPLVQLVLPVIASERFGDPVALGLMVASFGIGGLAGSTAYGAWGPAVPRRPLYAAIFVVWPASYLVVTMSSTLGLTLAVLAVLGAAAGALVPLQSTVRQERSPAHLLPRVVGLSTVALPVALPVAALGTGALIDALGLTATTWITSGLAVAIGVAVLSSRTLRLLDDRRDGACPTPTARPAGPDPSGP